MDWKQLNERLSLIEERLDALDSDKASDRHLDQVVQDLERQIEQAKSDAEYYTDRAVRDVSGQVDSHERSHR